MRDVTSEQSALQVLQLHAEAVEVSKRKVDVAVVRVERTTSAFQHHVAEELVSEHVVVERVPIGRAIDAVPPVREEGDTTILSVVEEVVVVERRLVLKEEVRIRRVKTAALHEETVSLRRQDVTVERILSNVPIES